LNKDIDKKFSKYISKYDYNSNNWLGDYELYGKDGIYVNLENNKEGFTGYQGQNIWKAIYNENCFLSEGEKMCLEKKIFFKIISGYHANVNLNICSGIKDNNNNNKYNDKDNYSDYSYINLINNLMKNILEHKDRINNLFFLHSLFINAFIKSNDALNNLDISTGLENEDLKAKNILKKIQEKNEIFKNFTERINNSRSIKKFFEYEKINELKMRFRNISEIVNCVSCQKCRLHGKMQIYGIATMLKILYSKQNIIELNRNELIAFVNTFYKITRSIKFFEEYLNDYKKNEMNFQNLYFALIVILCIFSYYVINKD
jgi:hypothetical protein